MSVLLYFILFCINVLGVIAYLLLCAFAVWVVNYKKTWQKVLSGIGALVLTPILFFPLWALCQYLYERITKKLN